MFYVCGNAIVKTSCNKLVCCCCFSIDLGWKETTAVVGDDGSFENDPFIRDLFSRDIAGVTNWLSLLKDGRFPRALFGVTLWYQIPYPERDSSLFSRERVHEREHLPAA